MSRDFKSKTRGRSGGFTLIEILVAGSVFAMIFIGATSVFLFVLRAQRETLQDVRVVDSARSAMEEMSRTIRTVNERDILDPPADTNSNPASPNQRIAFLHNAKTGGVGCPSAPCEIVYHFDAASRTLYETSRPAPPSTDSGITVPLTSSNVEAANFGVILRGRGPATGGPCDNAQPRVTLILHVRERGSIDTPLRLATTVSLRPLEICP